MMRTPSRLLGLTTLGLALAACGQQAAPSAPTSGDTVTLTLRSPLGLSAQGVPSDANGLSTVRHLAVKVTDANGKSVAFDGNNVYRAGGNQNTITLTPETPSATVVLPRGTYRFESVGKSAEGGTFLAWGKTDAQDLSASSAASVKLHLNALASEAQTRFADKMSWKSVAAQEILDLRLNVINFQGDLVPTSDYGDVTYTATVAGITEQLSSSKLGARLKVIGKTDADNVVVRANFMAWQVTGAETAAFRPMTKTFTIDLEHTELSADFVMPTVTMNLVGTVTAGQLKTLKGTASDNSGDLASVRVYDGVTLIGSTDSSEHGKDGVGEITLANGGWTLGWTPTQSAADLTVIAADRAGNERRAVPLKVAKTFGATTFLHNVAVKQDGTVAAWGQNGSRESTVPAGLTGVVAAAAGWNHSLALKADGTVVGWGANGAGQTTIPAGLTGVVAISAGENHSMALKAGGTVVAWGNNDYGQTTVPAGLTDVVAISAGWNHSMALKADGTLVAWGRNWESQLNIPAGLTDVVAISAGHLHSVALKSDGTVVAWAYFHHGQTNVPVGLTGVVGVSAGAYHNLALKADGTVVGWGYNGDGQLNIPDGLTNVVAISAGRRHSMALKADGTLVAWGGNSEGQLDTPAGPYLVP